MSKSTVPHFSIRGGWQLLLLALALTWGNLALAQSENKILSIDVSGTDQAPSIFIKTQSRPNSSVFTLADPLRLVVDVADAVPAAGLNTPAAKGAIRQISTKEFRDREGGITRVNIGLEYRVTYTSDVREDGIMVQITGSEEGSATPASDPLGEQIAAMGDAPQAAAEPTQAESKPAATTSSAKIKVSGLDFLPFPDRSRIRIETTEAANYKVVDDDPTQLVINLSNTAVPKAYQRPLDTSEFISAVKMISAYPVGGNSARIVVKMAMAVPYEVTQSGNFLYVDLDVPEGLAESMARAAANNPAPQATGGQATAGSAMQPTMVSGGGSSNPVAGGGGGSMGLFGSKETYADPEGDQTWSGQRFSIDIKEMDIHNVLRLISAVGNVNIVTSDEVGGTVTVRLNDVPWDQALAVILQAKSYGAVRFGNIIRVSSITRLRVEREQALEAKEASVQLERLQLLILPVNYASVNEVEKQVRSILSERGKLSTDTRTNSLIIQDIAARVAEAQAMVARLDTRTPEVLIEARVVEASSTFLREFGIQWGGLLDVSANASANTGLVFPNWIQAGGGAVQDQQGLTLFPFELSEVPNWVIDLPTATSGAAMNLSMGSLGGLGNLDARLSAVESMGRGRVVSSPRVTTVDNKPAKILQGTKIPYATVSAGGTQVQFIDASLELTVTPHITGDNRVFMEIQVKNNRPDFGNAVDGQPAVEVKEAFTEVMVPDGDTTVIGGVFTEESSESQTGVPGLYKLPLIGWMFRNTTRREDRKELLVFITPHIVKRNAPSQSGGI